MFFGILKKIFYLSHNVNWNETNDVDFPFESIVNGKIWRLRLNDFPEEQLFTLFIDNKEIFNFDIYLENWKGIGSIKKR
jgi:hypothetical protein